MNTEMRVSERTVLCCHLIQCVAYVEMQEKMKELKQSGYLISFLIIHNYLAKNCSNYSNKVILILASLYAQIRLSISGESMKDIVQLLLFQLASSQHLITSKDKRANKSQKSSSDSNQKALETVNNHKIQNHNQDSDSQNIHLPKAYLIDFSQQDGLDKEDSVIFEQKKTIEQKRYMINESLKKRCSQGIIEVGEEKNFSNFKQQEEEKDVSIEVLFPQENEQSLQNENLLDHVQSGIVVFNHDKKISFLNQQATNMLREEDKSSIQNELYSLTLYSEINNILVKSTNPKSNLSEMKQKRKISVHHNHYINYTNYSNHENNFQEQYFGSTSKQLKQMIEENQMHLSDLLSVIFERSYSNYIQKNEYEFIGGGQEKIDSHQSLNIKHSSQQGLNEYSHCLIESLRLSQQQIDSQNIDKRNQKNKILVQCFTVIKNHIYSLTVTLLSNNNNGNLLLLELNNISKYSEQLVQTNVQQYKRRVLCSISHELRTPLNCSIQLLDMLCSDDSINLQVSEIVKQTFIQPALYSNYLLINIINDILDLAQINYGEFKLTFMQFDIRKILLECVNLISLQAQYKQLTIKLDIHYNVPNIVHNDPNRLRQVLLNLLTNALKFTQQGSITLRAFIANSIQSQNNSEHNEIIQVEVEDTGAGISPIKLQVINNSLQYIGKECGDQFYSIIQNQENQKEDNDMNTGLGLTIANNLASGLGCNRQLRVASILNQGSTFTFFIVNHSHHFDGCIFNKSARKNHNNKSQSSIIPHYWQPFYLSSLKNTSQNQINDPFSSPFTLSRQQNLPPQTNNFDSSLKQINSTSISLMKFNSEVLNQSFTHCGNSLKQNLNPVNTHTLNKSNQLSRELSNFPSNVTGVKSSNANTINAFNHIHSMNNNSLTSKSSSHSQSVNSRVNQMNHINNFNTDFKYQSINNTGQIQIQKQTQQQQQQFIRCESNVNHNYTNYSYNEINHNSDRSNRTKERKYNQFSANISNNQSNQHNNEKRHKSLKLLDESINFISKKDINYDNYNNSNHQNINNKNSFNLHQQDDIHIQKINQFQLLKQQQQLINKSDSSDIQISADHLSFKNIPNEFNINIKKFRKQEQQTHEIELQQRNNYFQFRQQEQHQEEEEDQELQEESWIKQIDKQKNNSTFQKCQYQQVLSSIYEKSNEMIDSQCYIIPSSNNQALPVSQQLSDRFLESSYEQSNNAHDDQESQQGCSIQLQQENEQQLISMVNLTVMSHKEIYPSNISNNLNQSKSNKQFSSQFQQQSSQQFEIIKEEIISYNTNKKCSCPQILIVDDNEFNIFALDLRLKQYKFITDKATSGQMGIKLVQEKLNNPNNCCKLYKVIFMDIDMPIKNGYQTTQEVISYFKSQGINKNRFTPISACTAYVSENEKNQAKQSGMSYYITKPVNQNQLEIVLKQCLFQKF